MPSAKTMRAQRRKAERNRSARSFTRSRVRTAIETIDKNGASDESSAALSQAASALDKAKTKGVIHRNKASRLKSRLAKRLNKSATS